MLFSDTYRIFLCSLALAVLPLAGAGAQSAECVGTLQGMVATREAGRLQPLPGATVYLSDLRRGTVADAEGRYRLDSLCAGTYQVTVQFLGYVSLTQTRRVAATATLDAPTTVLTADAQTLDEVLITEHRSEAQQVLQTQTDLSGAALEQTRGLSLGESLKGLPGLYTLQTGPTIAKPVIHGLYSNRILILNNGIRQEDQQWGTEHAPQIDPFVASRLTVIRGAASVRYGSDAVGGVILVEPAPLPERPGLGGAISTVAATNGRLGAISGFLEGAADKKLAGLSWRVQGTLKGAGYVLTPGYFLENTSYRETNFSGDVHYGKEHWGVEAYFSRFQSKTGLFTGAQVGSLADLDAALARPEPLRQPDFSYRLDRPYQDVTHSLLKLRAYRRSDRWGTLTATYAWQQNKRSEFDFVAFAGRLNPELFLELNTHTADVVWEHRARTTAAGGRWSGSVGLTSLTQGNIRRFLFLIPNFRANAVGAFALERYARGRWTLEAGLRADYRNLRAFLRDNVTDVVSSEFRAWQNVTGSLGASFQAGPRWLITANLGTAWRAPNVNDLFANGLHQSAVAFERGNPNLRTEQAYEGNVAFAYAGERLNLEVGLYNNRITNYIYLRPDSLPIVRQRGAFPSYTSTQVLATFRGIDATFQYKLGDRLTLLSRTSLLWAYNHTERDYLVFVPPNRTENGLRYTWADRPGGRVAGLYVSVNVTAVARQDRAPAVTQREAGGRLIYTGDFAPPPPGYTLLGAEVGGRWQVAGRWVNVILTGTNLLNATYRDYLNRFRYFADEPGRNIILKVRVPFGTRNEPMS